MSERLEKINDGGAALPAVVADLGKHDDLQLPGMSLRDYFAAKAMQSQVGNTEAMAELSEELRDGNPVATVEDRLITLQACVALWAYRMADAMLLARKRQS